MGQKTLRSIKHVGALKDADPFTLASKGIKTLTAIIGVGLGV
jgi:hypothetical protein